MRRPSRDRRSRRPSIRSEIPANSSVRRCRHRTLCASRSRRAAWKIAGRLGDSPIIGAGIYLDPEVGGAGVTGNGEENIKIVGARTVVENMRHGMPPHDAAMDVLERLVHNYNKDMTRLRYINLVFHVLRRDGAYAGVALWGQTSSGKQLKIAVHDGEKRLENVTALLEGPSLSWPPIPELPKAR